MLNGRCGQTPVTFALSASCAARTEVRISDMDKAVNGTILALASQEMHPKTSKIYKPMSKPCRLGFRVKGLGFNRI